MTVGENLFGFTNVPRLLDGETLYNWCGRVHGWNGGSNAQRTSQLLFGAPYAGLLHDFPSHLNELEARTQGFLGDMQHLALSRTLLGYFLPTQAEPIARELLNATKAGATSYIKYRLGIPASRIGAFHPLKGCPACFNEDESRFGISYWHVCHQYPSVVICPKHALPLWKINDPVSPVHRREWILPRTLTEPQVVHRSIPDSLVEPCLRLARFSAHFAELPPASLAPSTLARTYLNAMRSRGLVSACGSLRLASASTAVLKAYEGLESFAEFSTLRSLSGTFGGLLGALARKHPRPGHPLKHLILIAFLFDTWGSFMDSYVQSGKPNADVPAADRATEAESDSRREAFVQLVRVEHWSVTAAARRVGVTTTTGVCWAKAAGLPFVSRAKEIKPETLAAVRALLATGEEKVTVVTKTGMSAVSVNRLLSSEPPIRAAWQTARTSRIQALKRTQFSELLARHPGVPLRHIRRIPGNAYAWLYRHDRDWLAQSLPKL